MKPIYVAVVGTEGHNKGRYTGLATVSDFVLKGDGKIVQYNNQNQPKVIRTNKFENKVVVWSLYDLKKKLASQADKEAKKLLTKSPVTTKEMKKDYLDSSIQTVKGQDGQNIARRAETSSGNNYSRTVKLTLNATGSGEAVDVVIGDGLDLFKEDKNLTLGAFEADGGVIDGTFGKRTLKVLRRMSLSAPFVVKGMQIQTTEPTGALFAGNFLNETTADVQNVTNERPIDFAINQDGTQFNQFQRKMPQFQFYFGQWTGLRTRFAAGQSVTYTFNIESVADASLQHKL